MEDSAVVTAIVGEIGKRVVGQSYMAERLFIGHLTGGHVLLEGGPGLAKTLSTGNFLGKKGPIFADLVLADEINRAPAKVQAALLDAVPTP